MTLLKNLFIMFRINTEQMVPQLYKLVNFIKQLMEQSELDCSKWL